MIDGDGYFSLVSRTKDVINTAGFKVWPREVEDVLYHHPGVCMAAVVGVPDGYRGEVVKAWVVLKEEYQVPHLVEFRTELPMTVSGKVLRRELRNRIR